MELTTTLQRLKDANACADGYRKLLKHVGCKYDMNAEINLLTILVSNGVQDMLWCLRATVQDSKRIASQLAIEFAAEVLPIFEKRYPDDMRPHNAIQASRYFLDGKITENELRQARCAAADAANNAYAANAAYAAYAAAAYAADAAYAAYAADAAYAANAAYAAYAAAAYAADAAAAAANAAANAAYAAADARKKQKERQAEIIKSIMSWE